MKPTDHMSEEQKVLTKDIAQQYSDGKLDIFTSRFSSLEPEAAEILVSAAPVDNLVEEGCEPGLYLTGLTELSEDVASALAKVGASKFEESRIYLSGLKTLSAPAAKALASCRATLDLSGLTSVSESVAESLGQHVGCLYLDGVEQLSDQAASALAQQKGVLRLRGLKAVTDATAAALVRHQWPVLIDSSILGKSASQLALLAKIADPIKAVEIGVIDRGAEIYGSTRFKVCWDLDETLEEAGFDIDWSQVSVMYDFKSGKAWNFEILPELIEKGVAVPNLAGEILLIGPDGETAWSNHDNRDMYVEESNVADVIRRVHAHGLDLIALKDSQFSKS
jgi:hypothetical protein